MRYTVIVILLTGLLLVVVPNAMAKESGVGRYALIERATGKVVNVIMLDPSSDWSSPKGHIVIRSDKIGPGDIWDGKEFTKAPLKEPEPAPPITADGNDVAEYMKAAEESLLPGDLVAVHEKGMSLRKSNKPYEQNIIGVVSVQPGVVLGNNEDGTSVLFALTGRVPVKVSLENGPIAVGDSITSSSIAGVGMKATKAGQIIGKALEGYGGAGVGKIMVFVNLSWYDPDVYITSTGDFVIKKIGQTDAFILENPLGKTVEKAGAFSEIASANIRAGYVHAESITANSLSIAGQNLHDYIASVSAVRSASAATGAGTLASMESLASLGDLRSEVRSLSSKVDLLSSTASISAFLSQSDTLGIKDATVSGRLAVLGRTTLSDLGVTGNINAGLLSINGLEGEIYTLSGNLKLQSLGLGGVDILNGKVAIDKDGNITTKGSITAKEIKTEKLTITNTSASGSAVLAASAGSVTIKAGTNSLNVNTAALTSNSLIFAAPERAVAVGTKKKDIDTFTISLQELLSEDVKVSWWVVN